MIDTESWLQCMDCGHKSDLLTERKFRCPGCNGLYDVRHDFGFITGVGSKAVSELKALFERRQIQTPDDVLTRSGVWRFHEILFPSIRTKEIVSLGEGMIPILPAGNKLRKWVGGDLDLWFLLEGLSTTGSFKDFGGTVAMTVASIMKILAVICASTGDTSAMAAAYAAAARILCSILLPKGAVTDVQLPQPLLHWAKVVLVPGNFDVCMSLVEKLVASGKGFPINSLNPTRIEGHQASVFLIAQFFGWEMVDGIFVPGGNGSNGSSVGKGKRLLQDLGFVDQEKETKIVVVQSQAANPLAMSWEAVQENGIVSDVGRWLECYKPQTVLGETTATAQKIGKPVSYKKIIREVVASRGAVLTAQEPELNEAVMVAGSDGFSVCSQTGTALAGLRQAVQRGIINRKSRIVVVSTATGLKFPEVPLKYGRSNLVESRTCELEEVSALMGI